MNSSIKSVFDKKDALFSHEEMIAILFYSANFNRFLYPGLVKHEELDDRAFDALKEFECEGACAVLQQFKDSNLSHVQNKSAFLCGVMKTYRQVSYRMNLINHDYSSTHLDFDSRSLP